MAAFHLGKITINNRTCGYVLSAATSAAGAIAKAMQLTTGRAATMHTRSTWRHSASGTTSPMAMCTALSSPRPTASWSRCPHLRLPNRQPPPAAAPPGSPTRVAARTRLSYICCFKYCLHLGWHTCSSKLGIIPFLLLGRSLVPLLSWRCCMLDGVHSN